MLIAVAGTGCLSAFARWRSAEVVTPATGHAVGTTWTGAPPASDSALEEAEALAVTNDPFRLSNSPPDVRFDPVNEGAMGGHVAAPPLVRPAFVLKAIVGGPPWNAVVDGIPGQPSGTVAQQGARYDKLVVRSITRDSVIIQGPDTTWVLRFGRRS
jgi:hypothetical protein